MLRGVRQCWWIVWLLLCLWGCTQRISPGEQGECILTVSTCISKVQSCVWFRALFRNRNTVLCNKRQYVWWLLRVKCCCRGRLSHCEYAACDHDFCGTLPTRRSHIAIIFFSDNAIVIWVRIFRGIIKSLVAVFAFAFFAKKARTSLQHHNTSFKATKIKSP